MRSRAVTTARLAIFVMLTSLLACEGPAGEDGEPGEDGEMGPEGPPGEAAWDLNGNGDCDTEEDTNDDGECNGLDLVGGAGIACWDLNENGECDAADEDADGDGECTVADCAGVSTGLLSGVVINDGVHNPGWAAEVVSVTMMQDLVL